MRERVAVVGIGGVGKEYIRQLQQWGIPMLLMDKREVLDREIVPMTDSVMLSNTFPGYEFDVHISTETPIMAVEDYDLDQTVEVWEQMSVSHVVHATPPHARSLFLHTHLDYRFRHHVEKPYRCDVDNEDVSVGYQYYNTERGAWRIDVQAPDLGGWRHGMGDVPIVWDLGGHALSLIEVDQWARLKATAFGTNPQVVIAATDDVPHNGVGFKLAYSDDESFTKHNNHTLDWRQAFAESLYQFLADNPRMRAPMALALEQHLTRIEGEIVDYRSGASLGGAATHEQRLARS